MAVFREHAGLYIRTAEDAGWKFPLLARGESAPQPLPFPLWGHVINNHSTAQVTLTGADVISSSYSAECDLCVLCVCVVQ